MAQLSEWKKVEPKKKDWLEYVAWFYEQVGELMFWHGDFVKMGIFGLYSVGLVILGYWIGGPHE